MSVWGSPVLTGGGGAADCWWRVRFYNYGGTVLRQTEYVQNGDDCLYGSGQPWAMAPGGEAVSGVTGDVTANLDLYYARSSLLVFSGNVLAESECADYTPGNAAWGSLTVAGAASIAVQADGSLRMDGAGEYVAYSLAAANTSYTAYMVGKSNSTANGDYRTLFNTYVNSAGNCNGFFRKGSHIWTSAFGQDADSGVPAGALHVMAMSVNVETHQSKFYIDGVQTSVKTFTNSGQTIGFGGEPNQYGSHDDISVFYAAVVEGAESEETIIANQQNIMSEYEIEE